MDTLERYVAIIEEIHKQAPDLKLSLCLDYKAVTPRADLGTVIRDVRRDYPEKQIQVSFDRPRLWWTEVTLSPKGTISEECGNKYIGGASRSGMDYPADDARTPAEIAAQLVYISPRDLNPTPEDVAMVAEATAELYERIHGKVAV